MLASPMNTSPLPLSLPERGFMKPNAARGSSGKLESATTVNSPLPGLAPGSDGGRGRGRGG
jgi:hypothetical protein